MPTPDALVDFEARLGNALRIELVVALVVVHQQMTFVMDVLAAMHGFQDRRAASARPCGLVLAPLARARAALAAGVGDKQSRLRELDPGHPAQTLAANSSQAVQSAGGLLGSGGRTT